MVKRFIIHKDKKMSDNDSQNKDTCFQILAGEAGLLGGDPTSQHYSCRQTIFRMNSFR